MKILITGGGGYIGSELAFALDHIDEVEEITIYDNLSRKGYGFFLGDEKLSSKFHFVKGDILDSRKLKKEVNKADVVIHAAAKVTYPFMDTTPHEFEQVNHWGSSEVVYAVENSDVKKFIHLSSVAVYGANDQIVEDIHSPLMPLTYYGISKKRAEEHVERIVSKKDTYIFRIGNVYGFSKRMRFDSVVNRFMFEANYHDQIMIKGNGEQGRTFIHIDTVVKALVKLLEGEIEPGTYNLTESNWSILDIAEVIKELYPETDIIFANRHFPIKSIKVEPDPAFPWLKERNLKRDLALLKKYFVF